MPFVVLYVLLFLVPAVVSLAISFTKWPIIGNPKYIGLANYTRLMNDPLFWTALKNTIYYTVAIVVIMYLVGLALAVLLNTALKGRIIIRTTVFSAYVMMVPAVGILWRWILEPNYGLLNFYLQKIGIPPVDWLTNPSVAMWAIVLATLWWTAGYNMVVFLAGLQEIPEELYEASVVDGCNGWQKFIYITMPTLRPVSFFVVVMSVAKSFQMFGQVFVMTQGGPSNSTLTLVQYLYLAAFRWYEMGYASAVAYALFILLSILTVVQFQNYFRNERKIL